jgi:predicted kinase
MHVKILSGIPGSGKSTYAAALVADCEAGPVIDRGRVRIVSADSYFMHTPGDGSAPFYDFKPENLPKAHAACLREFVREILGGCSDETVIVDNTNTTIVEMAPYVALAAAYGHTCEIVTFVQSTREDMVKVASRNIHGVPREVCERMFGNLMARDLPRHWKVTETRIYMSKAAA